MSTPDTLYPNEAFPQQTGLITTTRSIASELLGRKKITINVERHLKTFSSNNVIGVLPGKNRDRFVVVSAHYDHLGSFGDETYVGADDNASGVAAMLEIARAMKMGPTLEYSVIFAAFTAEEVGNLGSKSFVRDNPELANKVVANINIDMIGRIDEAHSGKPNYLYAVGAFGISNALGETIMAQSKSFQGLDVDPKYNYESGPRSLAARADNWSFASKGVPAVSFFSGIHPDYHTPTDTVENLSLQFLGSRADFIHRVVRAVAK